MKYQAIKGTKDILPAEVAQWQRLEQLVHTTMARYRYQEIRTPVFEMTELFKRSIGEGTDIVNKEMYSFTDNGGRDLTLKPEGTAAVARAFLQHHLGKESRLVKLYYLFSLYRQENPQEGRLREHHQFGVEAFGSDDPALDYEVIQLLLDIYDQCAFREYTIHLNTIGCSECRPEYIRAFKEFLAPQLNSLCKDCQKRYEINPLRIFDCKQPGCQKAVNDAPVIHEAVCATCGEHFNRVQAYLKANSIDFILDKKLVRGLDYYTRTTFEIKCGLLGAQNTVGGGGRYNGLIEELGGEPVPAIGFGSGFERLLLALDKQKNLPEIQPAPCVFCAVMEEKGRRAALPVLQDLRKAGVPADLNYIERSLKAQMREANRIGAGYVVIFGEEELSRQEVTVRDMGKGDQHAVALPDVAGYLRERLAIKPEVNR
jgi:histidyl-tRNA synthetase